MPVLAYQSFNSNSSTTHGFAAMNNQHFTRGANASAVSKGHGALVLPSSTDDLNTPIEGPAQLLPIQQGLSPQTVNVFGTQISLLWQNVYREFQKMPDIMVCGEMDASHPDFANFVSGQQLAIHPVKSTKACQCFTAISQSPVASKIQPLANGEGFVVYSVGGLVVVFVHVPNAIAKSDHEAELFYRGIAKLFQANSAIIDVVMGDTNQGSPGFTAAVLNDAFGTNAYRTAGGGQGVTMVDNWMSDKNVQQAGTNSTGKMMYDVAVYRSDLVDLKGVAYISQSSGAITVTDHCGLGAWVERKS